MYSLKTAWRYLRSRRSPLLSVVSFVTILGIAFAVLALLVSMAVLRGFSHEYERSILAFNAHVVVMSGASAEDWPALESRVRDLSGKELKGLTPFVYREALALQGAQVRGLALKAVRLDEYWKFSGLSHQAWQDGVLWVGKLLAQDFQLKSAQAPLRIRLPGAAAGEFLRLPVAGIFDSGMYDYDTGFALLDLNLARERYHLGERLDGIELWLNDPQQAPALADRLSKALDEGPYSVYSWQDLNANLFGALKLERLLFTLIMSLLILVASFNITGTLTMRILERRGDIAILRTMGASWRQVRRIFWWQGFILGMSGAILGLTLGLGMIYALTYFRPIHLAAELYFIDFVPALWTPAQLIGVLLTAALFSALASFVALLKMKRLSIIEALGES